MRFVKWLLRQKGRAGGSGSLPRSRDSSKTLPSCDRCGKAVEFAGPDSGTVAVTFSSPPVTTTLCAACTLDERKERQWRETGIWVGSDLPPSLRNARTASPEELRKLLGKDR